MELQKTFEHGFKSGWKAPKDGTRTQYRPATNDFERGFNAGFSEDCERMSAGYSKMLAKCK